MTPSGIEPATFRLAAQCHSQLRQRAPPISGGVTGFFSDIFPSHRIMALGSTQPLVEMSDRNIPGGKGGRCLRLKTLPPSRTECHENLGA